ncbi:MAG: hypothetical protein K2P51_07840 [Rhabdochlamydiaceae bacterium]|nr:hypothetical protein [Rhabdochlamydiaceae bacterium]
MKKQESKKINQTFSIPLDVSQDLHTFVKRREMSQFVSNAIRKELASKKEELKQAYLASNEDEGQQTSMEDWKNTINDGSNEW